MFLKASAMESSIFFWNEEGVSGVLRKITLGSIVVQKGTNILIFDIFEYGA